MPEGTINGQRYPIAVNEQGQVQWQTVGVAEERDEVWEDWSMGMGEDYFFSEGFDGSIRNVLHPSPFYHNDNNPTDLSTEYGYGMEDLGPSQAATEQSTSPAGKDTTPTATSLAFDITVDAGNENRILIVGASFAWGADTSLATSIAMTYAGQSLRWLNHGRIATGGDSDNGFTAALFYLVDPPVGTGELSITWSQGTACSAAAVVYYGIQTSNPWRISAAANGTSDTPSITIASTANDIVIDIIASGDPDDTMTASDDETQALYNEPLDDDSSKTFVIGAASYEAGAASVTASWTLTESDNTWCTVAASLKPLPNENLVSFADADKITEYKSDPDEGLTDNNSQTIASAAAGQPAFFLGKWYAALGNAVNSYRLDSPGTGTRWVDASFKARHLCTFQQGVTPLIIRANSATGNLLESSTDASSWTTFGYAGDTSETITGMVQSHGQLYVATDMNLYEFGLEGESRPLITFLNPGNSDADNGKGICAFGDTIIYPCNQGLWRYRIGQGALPVGVESLRGFRRIPGITAPKDRRPAFVATAGEWWYVLHNSADRSLLLQMRQRREGDPGGHEMIILGLLDIPLSKGVFVDSQNNLWLKGASTDEGQRDIRVIQLDDQGGTDVFKRRGQVSADHDIYFQERNPGRPQDKVQLRHFTVDLAGDWDATTSLQPKVWLDNGTSAVDFGAAITSAGVTIRNPTTFGTSDECYRFRPQLTLTTNASYTPKASDPQILKAIVGIRFPEIIRITVAADDALLSGMTAIDAEQNLRRLQNQGVVAFGRPAGDGETDITTFNAEVTQVKDVMFQNTQGTYCHGLELIATRWITS